eukprot:scaffold150027_cov24-Tisochrysis_lutea.AAC.3
MLPYLRQAGSGSSSALRDFDLVSCTPCRRTPPPPTVIMPAGGVRVGWGPLVAPPPHLDCFIKRGGDEHAIRKVFNALVQEEGHHPTLTCEDASRGMGLAGRLSYNKIEEMSAGRRVRCRESSVATD